MARRPVDRGEELEDLRAGAADERPDDPLDEPPNDAALPEDREERGWADLPVLPPLPTLVYPPPLATRPRLVPEALPPVPLPRRSTTMIGPPMPYP